MKSTSEHSNEKYNTFSGSTTIQPLDFPIDRIPMIAIVMILTMFER